MCYVIAQRKLAHLYVGNDKESTRNNQDAKNSSPLTTRTEQKSEIEPKVFKQSTLT